MKTKYSYAEDGDGTFDIIRTVTDDDGNQNHYFVKNVENKSSAEIIVSELNSH